MTSRERRGFRQLAGRKAQAIAVGSALLLAGATATVVGAQQATTTPSTPAATEQRRQAQDEYLNRLAANLGVTVDRLRAALQQTALQDVDAALAAGRVTAEQAQAARDRINSGDLHLGPGVGRGGGFGRDGGRGGMFASSDQIATFLGITAEQLRTERQNQSLAAVAQAHGKSRQQLIDFLVSTATAELNEAVSAGRITQAQATERLADLNTRIAEKVDEVRSVGDRPARSGATGSSSGTATPSATPGPQ